jgi:SAM-dependent methyltransferase
MNAAAARGAVGANVRRLARANTRVSTRIGQHWSHSAYNVFREYAQVVAREMQRPTVTRMADIGAGRRSAYAEARDAGDGVHVIGVDISAEDMAENESLDERRLTDVVNAPLPFADSELDMIVSSSVLEHLQDVGSFVRESARVLRAGGAFIHVFPSRYAPFAVLNRMLPHRLKRSLLYAAHPETVGLQGFPAYYDRCYASAFTRLLEQSGFTVDSVRTSYNGSAPYFSIFVPAYVGILALEMAARRSGRADLCTTLLVVAHKAP